MMLKINTLVLTAMLIAMVTAFAATDVMAEECKVQWGDEDQYFIVKTAAEFPRSTNCDGVPCTWWLYEVIYHGGNPTGLSTWYQTIDGYGFNVDPISTFPSIEVGDPGGGAPGNTKFDCYGQDIAIRVIHYTSAWSGDPPKFGFAIIDNPNMGLGHSSMRFVFGSKKIVDCVNDDGTIGLPGPAAYVTKDRIVRGIIEEVEIDMGDGTFETVRFEINETDCTFVAIGPDGVIPQFPITEMQVITQNGQSKQVKEGWSGSKCDKFVVAGTINPICTDYCLGGWCINIPNCRPCNPNPALPFCPGATPPPP